MRFLLHALARPGVLYVPSGRLLYAPVPKVANNAIRHAVARHVGVPHFPWDRRGMPYRYVSLRGAARLTGVFRFTFVRHPMDRLLSCYAHKVTASSVAFKSYGRRFYPGMPFEAFAGEVCRIPDRFADRHFRSQHTFVTWQGRPVIDFVGRFERIEEDWDAVRRETGLGALPHTHATIHPPWQEAYTPDLLRRVAERYRDDLRLFGYAGP